MKIVLKNMDLKQIAESGQCFRWKNIDKDAYSVVAFDRYLEIKGSGDEYDFSCTSQEWDNIWSSYFDVTTDYAAIGELIMSSDDDYLKASYAYGSGIRILRQDLWEIIVSFIISQNNNITRISRSIDMLCQRCGRKLEGRDEYCFPRPGEVPREVFFDKSMGFGYRSEYLYGVFEYAQSNPEWLSELKAMSYDEAMDNLLRIKGIGKKVANCICLFGLHHTHAFPIDTHVKQILEKYYPDGFDFDRYKGVAGIVQQYLFYNKLSSKDF